MYKILGSDKKEYGPVTADQIRQWIGERRLDAQTQAQAEGTTEWKPLGSFPEFFTALATPSLTTSSQVPATLAPLASSASALPRTNPMAIAGLIMGILTVTICCCYGLPFNLLGIIFSSMALSQINKQPEMEKGKGMAIAGLALSIAGTIVLILLQAVFGSAFNFDEIMRQIKR